MANDRHPGIPKSPSYWHISQRQGGGRTFLGLLAALYGGRVVFPVHHRGCTHIQGAETFNEKPWIRYGRTRLDDRIPPSRPLIHRASRLVASAFAAVLFVMTAVPAVHASPNFQTILRKAPTSEHTGADTLTWLLTFTEPVTNVDPADFVVSGTTAALALEPLALDEEGCSQQWDATLSRRRPRGPEREGDADRFRPARHLGLPRRGRRNDASRPE